MAATRFLEIIPPHPVRNEVGCWGKCKSTTSQTQLTLQSRLRIWSSVVFLQVGTPLNWGSAIVTYPFFGKTAKITGRLLSIQGDCSIKEVQRRMAEIYGDRDGIARAVSRVLQSQESWGMIERVEKGKRLVRKAPLILNNEQIVTWLIEAVIRFTGKAVSLANLKSMPVLYPFVLDQSLAYAVSSNKKLELRSEGANGQFVALRG